jgi:predicted regulator of Ras-like GTPase activity (Roadblock/LC7/MglB family)
MSTTRAIEARKRTDLDWLLDSLVARVAGVDMGVLLSADGLLMARSASTPVETAEHLSATGSALVGLARSTARQFGRGRAHQVAIEMDVGYLLATTAGHGTCLAVLTAADADLGLVVYEMHLLVRRVGAHLGLATRARGPEGAGDRP